jgi:hypothetical protein
MKNKKANIAIVLLVLMTLVLAGATLFIFSINQGKIETKIQDYSFLNKIYLKENQMDFYINNILREVIKTFDVNEGKDKFIEKFKIELGKYKQEDGKYIIEELEKVNEQADALVFDNSNKKIILNLDIMLDEKPNQNMNIVYAYKKTFEKDL